METQAKNLALASPGIASTSILFALSIFIVVVGIAIKRKCRKVDDRDREKVGEQEMGLISGPGLRSVLTAPRSQKNNQKKQRVDFDHTVEENLRDLPPEPDDEANIAVPKKDKFENKTPNREL